MVHCAVVPQPVVEETRSVAEKKTKKRAAGGASRTESQQKGGSAGGGGWRAVALDLTPTPPVAPLVHKTGPEVRSNPVLIKLRHVF